MVLVQSTPQSRLSKVHPNPARVLGIAGGIAFNAALLMALAIPADFPLVTPTIRSITEVVDIEKKEEPEKKPEQATVVKREKVEEQKPQPRQIPQPVEQPAFDQVVVDQGSLAADPPAEPNVVAIPDPAPPSGPIPGVQLRYASATPPKYPAEQLRGGVQGTVMLQVLVDVDGTPLQVSIHTSSGNRELDRTAQQHVLKKWKFEPAMKDGRAVQAIGLVPIDFKLQ